MAGQSVLRRWKPFFDTFGHVDAAIEAADPSLSRDKIRRVRGDIVVLLCDAAGDENAKAEELCVLLDGVMAESLVTLLSVPAEVVPRVLASSSPDLANAVAALRGHESARVRGLARDVVSRWRAAVEDGIVGVSVDMEKLDALSQLPPPKSRAPVASSWCVRTEKTKASTKISESLPKKTPPFHGRAAGDDRVMRCSPEEKMEATKRKLREGYQEVEDAKWQWKIQVIEAPMMMEQRQQKMHPIIRERSQARCGSSTAVKRSLMSSFQRDY